MICPLCGHESAPGEEFRIQRPFPRICRRCPECLLISVDPAGHIEPERERARYLLHRNAAEDEGYVRFLRRLLDPVLPLLAPGMKGLDFGCGPSAVLGSLVQGHGLACDAYDPHFHAMPPRPPYDFILAAEVFEHFRHPGGEIAKLVALLGRPGILGIMTERWTDPDAFADWHYTSDPTHVAFYHARTLQWIGRRWELERIFDDGERVTILRRTIRGEASPNNWRPLRDIGYT